MIDRVVTKYFFQCLCSRRDCLPAGRELLYPCERFTRAVRPAPHIKAFCILIILLLKKLSCPYNTTYISYWCPRGDSNSYVLANAST